MSEDRQDVHGADDPHASFVQHVPDQREIQRVWSTYWMPLLKNEDGAFNTELLKGELYDSWFLVNEARRVYHHITGGLMDDLTSSAEGVLALAERKVAQRIYAAVHRGEDMEAPIGWDEVNAFLDAKKCKAISNEWLNELGLEPVQMGGMEDDEA
jgi:hypothetical protein